MRRSGRAAPAGNGSNSDAGTTVGGQLVLGVDLGITSTKVVAFRTDGTYEASHMAGYLLNEPHPGHAVRDSQLIMAAVLESVGEVVAEVGGDRVAGLSFSLAMHSLIGHSPTGKPVTDVVTCADTRSRVQAERLRASPSGLALQRRTGTPLHPMSPLPKLVRFREQEPKLYEGIGFWLGIKEYVLSQLLGALVTDYSVASATGLMNMHTLTRDEKALLIAGVQPEQLPELVPTTHILPSLTDDAAASMRLPVTTPVLGAADGRWRTLGSARWSRVRRRAPSVSAVRCGWRLSVSRWTRWAVSSAKRSPPLGG